jgi:endoglucanase
MRRLAPFLLLAAALTGASAASAQTPYPLGRLVPPEFAAEPAAIPHGPVGDYPEDWAKCVSEHPPPPQVYPRDVDVRGVDPSSPNPLVGTKWFVDRMEPAYIQWKRWMRAGKHGEAGEIWKLAREPRFRWFGPFTRPRMKKKVRGFLNRVQCDQPGAVPMMLVVRAIANDCGPNYMAGGAAEDRRTRKWYDDFAESVGDARVVIGFEPDSLGTLDCLAASRRDDRVKLLRYGVDVLSKLPNATIYLEGSASDWKSPSFTARALKRIGISKVRGFMVNVTHFDWTINNVRYGQKVSRKLGGKPFVVSTSYNGRGPVHYKTSKHGRRINVFCNVRYRGLGPVPTTNTGFRKVDAFLWLNRPGISGAGSCNGAPKNGAWWPARALMFAKYATSYLGPPRGTKFGFSKRISLCRLGAPMNGRYQRSSPEHRCKH